MVRQSKGSPRRLVRHATASHPFHLPQLLSRARALDGIWLSLCERCVTALTPYCGFAAAQCGKAPPYRELYVEIIGGFASNTVKAQPLPEIKGRLAGKAQPFRTGERQSRQSYSRKT